MKQLLTSRRVWTFIIAQVVAIATFLVANYIHDPVTSQLAAILIGTVEGAAAIVVSMLTIDDVNGIKADKEIQIAAIDAGTHPDYPVTAKSIENKEAKTG
jgi:hypothetical protein